MSGTLYVVATPLGNLDDLSPRAAETLRGVAAVPGPTAVAAALSVSGLAADRYLFLGFLPRKGGERRRLLDLVAESEWTTVLFEAPLRVVDLLDDLAAACGQERRAAVARELTKVFEETRSGTLAEL